MTHMTDKLQKALDKEHVYRVENLAAYAKLAEIRNLIPNPSKEEAHGLVREQLLNLTVGPHDNEPLMWQVRPNTNSKGMVPERAGVVDFGSYEELRRKHAHLLVQMNTLLEFIDSGDLKGSLWNYIYTKYNL